MYALKLTTLSTLLAAAYAQSESAAFPTDLAEAIPSELEPLVTASPSQYASIISSLTADGVSLPDTIPTDPAAISALASEAEQFTSVFPSIPSDYLDRLQSAVEDIAPTAAVSDLGSIISSAGPAIGSALGVPEDLVSSALADAPAQISSLEGQIPGSLKLTELAGYAQTAAGLSGAPPAPTASGYGNATMPASGTGAQTTLTSGTATQSGGDSDASSTSATDGPVSTGAAAFNAVGWTGALAGVAMGAVAFL